MADAAARPQAIQEVQISADGSAYAQHEPEAQALADALLGSPPAGMTCEFDKPTKVAADGGRGRRGPRRAAGIERAASPGDDGRRTGRALADGGWFVANADRLGIEQVGYAGRSWTRSDGWHEDVAQPASDAGRGDACTSV